MKESENIERQLGITADIDFVKEVTTGVNKELMKEKIKKIKWRNVCTDCQFDERDMDMTT